MFISDAVLGHYLTHVYFVGGGACGGKSTMAQMLAQKHGFAYYNCDEQALEYKEIADPRDHPAMLAPFIDWETYFGRSPREYADWLGRSLAEQTQMIVADLLTMFSDRPIVCEGHYPPNLIKGITTYNKSVFLYAERDVLDKAYFAREDKQPMLRLLHRLSSPEQKIQGVLDMAWILSEQSRSEAEELGLKVLRRTATVSQQDMLASIEQHFRLN